MARKLIKWVKDKSGTERPVFLNASADNVHTWRSADGEDGDEEMTEPEPDDIPSDVPPADLQRFRTLVKNKKLALKAQYGKGHFGTERVRTGSVCIKWNWKLQCVERKDIYINKPVWIHGWRRKWKAFKQAGGLAQLKLEAKGIVPPTGTGLPPQPNPLNTWVGGGRGDVSLGTEQTTVATNTGTQGKAEDTGEGMSTKMKWIIYGSIGAALLVTGIIVFVRMRKK